MSLDKSIASGKDHRKFVYHDSRDFDPSCKNHCGCSYCEESRLRYQKRANLSMKEQLEELTNDLDSGKLDHLLDTIDRYAEDDENYAYFKSSDLDCLALEERKKYCYCRNEGQTHCGKCACGKPGHLRGFMMGTFEYCDECYRKSMKEFNDEP